jgi:hypothetical protein
MRSSSALRYGLIALLSAVLVYLPPAASAQPQYEIGPQPAEPQPLRGIGGLWLREGRGIGGGVVAPLRLPVAQTGNAGSNHHWYFLGEGCEREPYGIVANLHRPGVRSLVLSQLIEMRAAGSDHIGLGVFHLRADAAVDGVQGGTLLDSTGGDLHPQMRLNLANLLADVRDAGFREVLFRFFIQGQNDPRFWSSWREDLFEENWNLIVNLMPILEDSGIEYRVDLMVEGLPRARTLSVFGEDFVIRDEPANSHWTRYANRMWQNYVSQFGPERSVGFSSLTDADPLRMRARVEHMTEVYRLAGGERVFPPVLALDIYGGGEVDEYTLLGRYLDEMTRDGRRATPLIIAESFHNDRTAARGMSRALRQRREWPLLYLLQWPVERDRQDCSTDVTVVPPTAIDEYLQMGF